MMTTTTTTTTTLGHKGKGKVVPMLRYSSKNFFTLALDGGERDLKIERI